MPRFILTDIEGTTTEVDFVHKVLFPYAAERMRDFIQKNASQGEVQACLHSVKDTMFSEQAAQSASSQTERPEQEGASRSGISDEEAIAQLLRWIAEDRKHTALKQLQGIIWKEGFVQGDYQGHVYADVPPVLAKWKNQGIGLGIYSSGSVQAQKLLFRYSVFGDLTPYFSHYFDTHMGGKKDADSYAKIAAALDCAPIDILFLSDIEEELDAAAQAGFQVMQLLRGQADGELASGTASKYPAVCSFADIRLEEASAVC